MREPRTEERRNRRGQVNGTELFVDVEKVSKSGGIAGEWMTVSGLRETSIVDVIHVMTGPHGDEGRIGISRNSRCILGLCYWSLEHHIWVPVAQTLIPLDTNSTCTVMKKFSI